ncbi:putative nucleotidyl transferase [Pectobacterium phage Q19]|uniref:Nucleotidyl transferase n=1 Tax=Pectobacterium phage Q19 TaxID=2500576 RepID=A0A678ZZM4_9CAUD|nr:putative nucleotidyl transferase [Pectobacterium phage Q19]
MQKQSVFLHHLDASIRTVYRWAIAGGACRNHYFGLSPKDYDVVVCLTDPEMRNHKGAFEFAKEVSRFVSIQGGSSRVMCAYGHGDFGERHLAVIKIDIHGDSYDLLVEHDATVLEAMQHFDCNLNQFFWDMFAEKVRYVGVPPLDELHWLKVVSEKRHAKMVQFFNDHVL